MLNCCPKPKFLISAILAFILFPGMAQDMAKIDTLCYDICEEIKTSEIENDSLLLSTAYEKHLLPFLRRQKPSKIEENQTRFFYRIQRICPEFTALLDRLSPPQDGFERLDKEAESIINESQLNTFKQTEEFYYNEHTGGKVKVQMKHGNWIETFEDGTYSKLDIKWTSDNRFELVFIKSNNLSRSNLSVKGDTYNYTVLSKEDGFYFISVSVPESAGYAKFKLYY